jgi:hypothetical protein
VTPASIEVDDPTSPFTTVARPAFVIAVAESPPNEEAFPNGTVA